MATLKVIKASAAIVGIAVASCPITECNYLDAQYKADFKRWSDCITAYSDRFFRALNALAILYPRFGIAYRAYSDEMNSVVHADGTVDDAAVAEAKRRFDDRILHTAEPEALQDYNLLTLQTRQHPVEEQCGKMPEPPKGQP